MRLTPEHASDHTNRSWHVPLLTALVVTGLLRGFVLVWVGGAWRSDGPLALDRDAYRAIAVNLIERNAFSRTSPNRPAESTAFRPPLYPYLLSVLCAGRQVDNLTVAILHWLLGLGTVAATFGLARAWHLSPWPAAAAAMLVGIDPLLLNQSTLVMTETLATFLAASCGLALSTTARRPSVGRHGLAGLLLGMAVLCRPTFLIWVALITCVSLARSEPWKPRLVRTATLLAGVLLLLTPWVIRNQQQLGKPILATTHGGYTLLLGNNPHFYQWLRNPQGTTVWDANELHTTMQAGQTEHIASSSQTHPEVIQDQLCYEEAWQTIQNQPQDFAYSCLIRIARLWTPLPHQVSADESALRSVSRYLIAGWYMALFLATLLGLFWHRHAWLHSPWVWALTLGVSLTLLHTFYWSNIRMRAPMIPFLCCMAVVGITTCGRILHSRRHPQTESNSGETPKAD